MPPLTRNSNILQGGSAGYVTSNCSNIDTKSNLFRIWDTGVILFIVYSCNIEKIICDKLVNSLHLYSRQNMNTERKIQALITSKSKGDVSSVVNG